MIGAIVSTVTDDQDVMSKLIDDAGPVAGLSCSCSASSSSFCGAR